MTITLLLLAHGIIAMFLVGAITHQSLAIWRRVPIPGGGFFCRVGAVNSALYTNAVIVLYIVVTCGGAVIYPTYVLDVKASLTDANMLSAIGAFEIKEHFAVFGLALLPSYAWAWKSDNQILGQRLTTTVLMLIVWWNFVIGHVLNNIKGL